MASATSESPLRRIAKELANKSNSPIEVNRLKSLLRKKIGEDATTPSSPKKSATPRKEVKVKRGATVKLCSSCENHNKDVKVKPRVDNHKEGKDEKTVDEESEAPRKTRTAKKKVEGQGQGQAADPADGASGTVEKKTAAKKPRETKKKTVTQGEKLGVPSTSGTVQSDSKGSALTDSGTTQAEGEAKPKRQRKKTEKSVQDKSESSVGKEKPKIKEIVKVKIALPKKKTKNAPQDIDKTSFENMNETDLVNSVHQEEEIQMQNPDGKSTAKSKSKKPNTGEVANLDETSTKNIESSVDEVTSSKSKTKAKGAVKPKVSRQKKTNKNISEELPIDDMDVTDLVTSIQQIEKQFTAEKPGTSNTGAKSTTNTSKGRHVNFEDSVAPDRTLVDTDEPSDNLESSSVAKEPPKSKAKANNATKVKSHLKKTTKNLPEDNPNAGIEDMDVTDLVNSIQERKKTTEKSSSSYKNKLRKPAKTGEQNAVNSISSNTTLNSLDKPSDNMKNNSHNEGIIESSGENSITSNEKGASSMNFGSDKTAPKDKLILVNASSSGSCLQSDQRNKPLIMHSSFEDRPSEFYIETNFEGVPEVGITGTSTGDMINLSSSTNISHNDLEGHSMSLNNFEERSANDPSIHNDETFYNGDFSHIAVDSIEAPANITLRTRANKKKNKKNASTSVVQENTSWADGSSFFTQKDRNDYMTQKDFNGNDENKQSSTADMEHLAGIKSEPVDDLHGTSSQSLSKQSEERSKEPNLSHEKSHKKTSKLAEPKSKTTKKSQAKTSEAVESVGQKTKNLKDSAKEAAHKSVDKSVNKSSHQESESSPKKKSKSKKNDETLCKKHKNSKEEDKKRSHHLAKEKKSDKQLKKDMKVAKAMAQMSEHFSKISIGTTIGTINELHIGKLSSDSDSSCDCSTDCSCSDYTSESTSSGGRCNCWKCLMTQSDPSDCECSSSDDDESSDESNSSESTISASSSSDEEIRHPKRMCSTKSAAKPTYKEKLNKFCSKYDLRSNSSWYGLRSKDK